MSDVSTYELEALETRVERLEKEHLRQLGEQAERDRRKTELLWRWTMIGIVMTAVIIWTVVLTLEISGNK